jgi:hypothetical protein
MTKQPFDANAQPRRKQTKFEDLPAREVTPDFAFDVTGGAVDSSVNGGLIIPCVRTIRGGSVGSG